MRPSPCIAARSLPPAPETTRHRSAARWCCAAAVLIYSGASGLAHLRAQDAERPQWPVVYQDDFESGPADAWRATDEQAWRIEQQGDNHVFSLHRQSNYEPEVRSPVNYSVVEDVAVGSFVLDVRVQSTCEDYGHRDLCLLFGWQDPSHFYYVHLGKEADPHAHSIFLVNGEPRVSIAEERTDGTPWDDAWHDVRLVRDVDSGLIEVYFDDMENPVMRTHDRHFTWGQVGVGSFDDTGNFDDFVLRGEAAEPENP